MCGCGAGRAVREAARAQVPREQAQPLQPGGAVPRVGGTPGTHGGLCALFPQVGYPRVGGTPGTHGGVPRVLTARVVCLFAQVGIVAVNLVGEWDRLSGIG